MNYNTFVDQLTTHKNLLKTLEKLESNIDRISLAICDHNNTYLQKDSYQLVAQLLRPNNSWERMLFQELIQTCFQLELKSQKSSILFLKAFIGFGKEYAKQENASFKRLVEDNQIEGAKYLSKILSTCKPASLNDISHLIDEITKDKILATAVKEAIKLAGIEGNIVLEENDGQNIVVELQFGYNFKINPFKGFIPQTGTWLRNNTKILLVDGLLEKVSEIDKILLKSNDTKIPLIIIAQGFSEEIVATIHANNTRGNFDIMPVRLEQSLEALNMLNDIAVVANSDVVSTLKGEMLTYVNYDMLSTIEKISITQNVLTIHNNSSRENVISHLNYLNTRRKDQNENTNVTDLSDLTTKRIQNLLAHIVKLVIPKNNANHAKSLLDNAIRACRTAYTYGFCEPQKINVKDLKKDWQLVHNHLVQDLNDNYISSLGLYLAYIYGSNLAANYFTASGTIIDSLIV